MLESSNWLAKLCYLSDIFERINVLNRTLQGKDTNLMFFHDKIKGFLATLASLKDKVSRSRFVLFPRLSAYMEETEDIEIEPLSHEIMEHIQSLIESVRTLLPQARRPVIHRGPRPFHCTMRRYRRRWYRRRGARKSEAGFQSENIIPIRIVKQFLVQNASIYTHVYRRKQMPYPSSYLCEQSFSTMVVMKTK